MGAGLTGRKSPFSDGGVRLGAAHDPRADTPLKSPDASTEAILKLRPRGAYALAATFGCGQIFRFTRKGSAVQGVCGGLVLSATSEHGWLTIHSGTGAGSFQQIEDFLNLSHDVREPARESLAFLVSQFPEHASVLRKVFAYSRGVHLLRQPTLETVIGYLLSVQSTVELVGQRLEALARLFPSNRRMLGGSCFYVFPTLDQLHTLSDDTVAALRLGYRSKWFLEIVHGLPDESTLESLNQVTSSERQTFFQRFAGVGPKVAACIDLFAYADDSAFPIDVWVERGLRHVLGMTSADIACVRRNAAGILGPHCGLFGEYLFRYERDGKIP